MGCCFSCDEDKTSQREDVNERSRLLGNPVSNNQARVISSDDYGGHHASGLQRGDEQSALSRILHQTATNVIDVSALDSHNLEQHEYHDRAKQYSQRVTTTAGSMSLPGQLPVLLTDVPSAEKALAENPPSIADLNLIHVRSVKMAKAFTEIVVEPRPDLVVNFGIP